MNKLDLYSSPQFFDTYLNFENVQRTQKAYNPFTNNLNPQNIKPNKYNSLSHGSEVSHGSELQCVHWKCCTCCK
jgi:hypothetical protein